MDYSKIKAWMSKHKIITGIFGLFIFLIAGHFAIGIVAYIARGGLMMSSPSYKMESEAPSPVSSPSSMDYSISFPSPMDMDLDFLDYDYSREEGLLYDDWSDEGLGELEVKEGRMTVKSENAENDYKKLEKIVKEKGGYIEVNRKTETSRLLTIYFKARIPMEHFDEFIREVKNSFETENYHTSNYRIDIRYQVDEIAIIDRALESYNKIRQEALEMPPGAEKVELLKMITDEEKNLVGDQAYFQRDLMDRERDSDMAKVSITIEEKITPVLWPEDLGNRFRDKINNAIESITVSFMNILVNSFILAIKVIEYLLYALIIIIPVIFVWGWVKVFRKKMQ